MATTTYLRAWIALIASLLPLLSVLAQPSFFEPTHGFYKARGARVVAVWSLDRDTVPEDGVLTATLTIRGAVNSNEIVRPDLTKVADSDGRHPYAERFQIENVPGQPVRPDAKEAIFVYRLRPRNRNVDKLPSLEFYYDTGKKAGNPFQKTWAKGPKFVVTASVKPKPPVVPLSEPERLFQIETGSRLLEREPFAAGWYAWLLLFAGGVLIAGGWFAVWRRIYPDGARLARLHRGRAVRQALRAIHKAGRSADTAGAIGAAVLDYLRARFSLPPDAVTPVEVSENLHELLAKNSADERVNERIEAIAAVLRHCDEARFAPGNDTSMSLAAEAESLLARLEAEA